MFPIFPCNERQDNDEHNRGEPQKNNVFRYRHVEAEEMKMRKLDASERGLELVRILNVFEEMREKILTLLMRRGNTRSVDDNGSRVGSGMNRRLSVKKKKRCH